jgi:hypothetical protein
MTENGPASFFQATSQAFADTIVAHRSQGELVGALCAQAFDLFEKNVALQGEGAPAIACHGECAACCRLRVVATAPEVLLLVRFVAVNAPAFDARGISLARRIADTAQAVGSLDEFARMAAKRDCPLIERDLCLAYRLRPLACRGHAALDKQACISAAEGEGDEAPVSTPHLVVRSLVQNAMMNSLRQAGLAWGLYEITKALEIASRTPAAIEAWIEGEDPLSPALIPEFDPGEAASLFDGIARI